MQVARRYVALGLAGASIGAGALALSSPAAAADPPGTQTISRTVTATCAFPIVGNQSVTVAASGTAPTTAVAGSTIKVTNLGGKIGVPDAVTAALTGLFHAASVEGAANASGTPLTTLPVTIDDNGTSVPRTIPATIAKATIPASNWSLNASVADQSYTTTKPGTISVSIGTSLTASFHVYDASGKVITTIGGDPVTFPCTLDPGQDVKLGSIPVTPQPTTSPTTSPTTGPTNTVATTTTALAVDPAGPAASGTKETLTATVTASDKSAAAGTVQFLDGTTSVGTGTVSGGKATATTTLADGSHSLTAKFTPTDATKQGASTSPAVSYTVSKATQPGQSASENLNVTVAGTPVPGALTLTIANNGPVDFGTPAAKAGDQTTLEATAKLNPVTVTDTRTSSPGWTLSGQTGDFTSGTNTIDGKGLGWAPNVDAANTDKTETVTPGAATTAGDGKVKAGAPLATGKGSGKATVGAGLTLDLPASAAKGTYGATLTVTVA